MKISDYFKKLYEEEIIPRDFRINTYYASNYLDKLYNELHEDYEDLEKRELLLIGLSIGYFYNKNGIIVNKDCIETSDKSNKDKRAIAKISEFGDEQLSFLLAISIDIFGIKIFEEPNKFKEVIQKLEELTNDGLKILYCEIFSKYYSSSPSMFWDILKDLNKIMVI